MWCVWCVCACAWAWAWAWAWEWLYYTFCGHVWTWTSVLTCVFHARACVRVCVQGSLDFCALQKVDKADFGKARAKFQNAGYVSAIVEREARLLVGGESTRKQTVCARISSHTHCAAQRNAVGRATFASSVMMLNRFLCPATHSLLGHPNVLSVSKWCVTPDNLWLVMELCPGGAFSTLLAEDIRLKPDVVHSFSLVSVRGLDVCTLIVACLHTRTYLHVCCAKERERLLAFTHARTCTCAVPRRERGCCQYPALHTAACSAVPCA